MVSLIQSYVQNYNNRPQPQNNKMQDVEIVNIKKAKPKFDIHRELANRTFIKPLAGEGKLVKNGITDIPAVLVRDIAYDLKSLKDGYSGKANDHQLGKLNDMGLMIGGLGLAGFLATKKQTPMTKAMEFIGLGSFLASMAIWPKVALQWPAQLIHGVNVFQQYEDSFGRKKNFYQDPQFIPWDLYSDEEINKIGDRLRVPRDIENRRDFIQEKMRKIAVQNNTLWMLTAGFATPVMSALICNQAEPYVSRFLNDLQMKKADKFLNHFAESAKSLSSCNIVDNINTFIELHKEKTLDDKMIKTLARNLTEGLDGLTTGAVEADLMKALKPGGKDTYIISTTALDSIIENSKKALKIAEIDKVMIDAVIPDKEQITKMLKEKGFEGKPFDKLAMQDILDEFSMLVRGNINTYNSTNPEKLIRSGIERSIILDTLTSDKMDKAPISKVLISTPAAKLDARAQSILKNVANVMTDFKARSNVLDKYAFMKFASAPETGLANYWNDVAESLVKIFKFTPQEIENTRMDREVMTKLLRSKIEKIAANDSEYTNVLKTICEKINTINDTVKVNALPKDYTDGIRKTYDPAAQALENIDAGAGEKVNFENTVRHFVGPKSHDGKYSGTRSLKNLQESFANNRLLGVRSTFERLINTMDFYRRIATLTNINSLNDGLPREIREELAEMCKQIAVDGHISDFETKFYMPRNPWPNTDDFSDIVVKDGVVENKYFGINPNLEKVDVPYDSDFFRRAMRLLYEEPVHPDTSTVITSTNMRGLNTHRRAVFGEIGDTSYFAKLQHFVFNGGSQATSERKFLLLGMAPDELFSKIGMRKYNTQKWLKIFGTIGGALLGVTLVSQFFFGRLKAPERSQKG